MQKEREGSLLVDEKPQRVRQDLLLLRRANRERWPIPQHVMDQVTERVIRVALQNPDDAIALDAAKLIKAMVAQNHAQEPDEPRKVEHHHVHELGPVTAENIEQHRQLRIARLAGSV